MNIYIYIYMYTYMISRNMFEIMFFKTNHKFGPKKTHKWILILICFVCSGLLFLPVLPTSATSLYQNNQLVYQNCENHGNLSRSPSIISTLLEELMENSNKSKYFATYAGDDEISILGLFQCRVDMSNHDCHNCVQNLPELSKNLCGTRIPARIQLSGCYIHYQMDQIRTWTSRLELHHKVCSRKKSGSRKFMKSRDGAFAAVLDQECYFNTGGGTPSCDVIYESLRVVAECEGNLGGCDCIECVKKAVEIAQDECGYSVSGEIFLDSCYLSYGINGGGSYGDGKLSSESSINNKLVAIIIGGIVAASFALFICYCCISWGKKKDDY